MLGLFVRRGFLDAPLCARLREQMRSAERNRATVRQQGSEYAVDPGVRRVDWAVPPEASIAEVESRLAAIRPEVERHFRIPLAGHQPPQFLAYREGDFYVAHRDSTDEPDAAQTPKVRRVSVVVFLNDQAQEKQDDCYGGGSLTFYGLMADPRSRSTGFPLAGEEGLLVAFRSETVHEVTPVTWGERYTIASWFFP